MAVNIRDHDDCQRLLDQIHGAQQRRTPLRIRGGDSKKHLGRCVEANELDMRAHTGVIQYDPSELVVTVRAGTRLHDLTSLLESHGQHLPPEAPDFGGEATVGGMVAAAVAGPRRPWAGSVRDFVLGCRYINATGKQMRFGGEVMKNVAGYDFSRLLAGSHGCLGVITEVSLKVLPLPRATYSMKLEADPLSALEKLKQWRHANLPISGAFLHNDHLHIRLEGGKANVESACTRLAGAETSSGIWTDLRDHCLPFFKIDLPLWRVSVPSQARLIRLPGETLLDWGGAQRWLKSDAPPQAIRQLATSLGGHATCYTPGIDADPFAPLAPAVLHFHRRLKAQLDPIGIFNPGRMYAEL